MYQRDWPAAGRGFLSLSSYSVMQAWRLPAQCSAQAQACWASGHFSPIFTARHTHCSSLTVVPEQHFNYALLCGTSGLLLRLLLCFKSFAWKQTEGWRDIEQNIERLWNEKTELFLGGVTETERNKTKQNSTQLRLSSCSGITLERFFFLASLFIWIAEWVEVLISIGMCWYINCLLLSASIDWHWHISKTGDIWPASVVSMYICKQIFALSVNID